MQKLCEEKARVRGWTKEQVYDEYVEDMALKRVTTPQDIANAVLFTLYHIHQPWTWLANLPYGLLLSFSGRYFRSNWFPIILHSGQTVFFLVIILGVVLGLA